MAEIKDRLQAKSGKICEALARLEGLVVEGLKHGFFDYSIACEIAKGGKRRLMIRAGKSYIFTITEDEMPLTRLDSGDPCDGDAQDANHVGPTSSV
jgi:hypothetical protein